MNPGVAIRRARLRSGLSQTELAERAGTSQATLSAYESGAKEPTISTLNRLLAETGHRLELRQTRGRARIPSRAALARRGEHLAEVMTLAEALPHRRPGSLRFPRLNPQRGGRRSRS